MADQDEFTPQDWDQYEVEPGGYLLQVSIKNANFRDTDKDKPFMVVEFSTIKEVLRVIDKSKNTGVEETGPVPEGFLFDNRFYLNPKAKWKTVWLLKKFGYPDELLKKDPPTIRKGVMVGLEGKLYVEFSHSNMGMLQADVKKIDYIQGMEIEEWLAKENKKQGELPLQREPGEAPVKDVHEDIRNEKAKDADLSALD